MLWTKKIIEFSLMKTCNVSKARDPRGEDVEWIEYTRIDSLLVILFVLREAPRSYADQSRTSVILEETILLSLFHQIFLFQVVKLSNRVSSTCRAAPRIGRSFLYRKNIPWIGYGPSWKFVALNKLLVLFLSRVGALTSRVDNFIILFAEWRDETSSQSHRQIE